MRHRASPVFTRSRYCVTDGVHYQESAGKVPVVLKVAQQTGASYSGQVVQEIGGVTNQGTQTQETKDMATIALAREETPGHHMIGHSGAEEGWTPGALSRQNADSYLQNQARISSRGPSTLSAGKSACHTEPGSTTTTKGLQTNQPWWQPSRRPSILDATSMPHSTAAAVRAIARQGELSSQPPTVLGMADAGAVWPEEPAPEYGNRISGENIAASSGTNRGLCLQPPTFHADGRLEAVPKRIIGSFETASGGDTAWRAGGGETSSISGGAAGGCWSQQGGIDAEVATAGSPWSRQSGGENSQRQPESLSTPSQRLSEMKKYFGRQEQVSTSSENEGNQHLNLTSNSGGGGGVAYRSRLEVAVDNGNFRGGDESHGHFNGSGNANGGDNRQADRTPWHGGCNPYPPPAVSTSTASTNTANESTSVGIVDHPSRDGIENGGGRSWNEGAGAAWSATATAGGDDGGEGGVGVDFDPHTESRNTQSAHAIAGGSPASWWKDASEPVVPAFRWDLQLPNLAPPLAQRHDPTGIRGVLESSTTTGVTKHASPLKVTMDPPALSGLGKPTSQHHRHRIAEPLYTNFSSFDVMDNAGVRYGARTGSGVSSIDSASRVTYGGQKWGINPPQVTGDAQWGLGFNGVSGGGSGRHFSRSRVDETRRGVTQLFDSVNPSGHYPTFNNGAFPVHSREMVQTSIHPGGAESLSRQDANPTSGMVREREIDGMGVALDGRVSKKTRVGKYEDLRTYTDWTGGLNGEESPELRRGFLAGGSEASAAVEAGMSEPPQKGKKMPASSRRCRAEGCKSHPNFGVEGDRRALYCAKHKLPGMVNVKAPRCQHPSCTRNPVYGNAGDPRATYCLSHKSPLMVDVKNRRCQYPNCRHQPSFGVAGDRRANFCFTHKLPSHVNIRRARAKAGETYNDSNGNKVKSPHA